MTSEEKRKRKSEINRRYNHSEKGRITQKNGYIRNKEKTIERNKKIKSTEEGKATHTRNTKNWAIKNPEKRKAHIAVSNAIRLNKLKKEKVCSFCEKEVRLYAHHFDYTKPLEVIFVCSRCHAILHGHTLNEAKQIQE